MRWMGRSRAELGAGQLVWGRMVLRAVGSSASARESRKEGTRQVGLRGQSQGWRRQQGCVAIVAAD